jgi:transposase
MSYVTHKIINGKKYAYDVTSYREGKKVKHKNKYLGAVDKDLKILPKKTCPEKCQLDFGNIYLLNEFFKKMKLNEIIDQIFGKQASEVKALIYFSLCEPSAMYNASIWIEGNYCTLLFKKMNLTSQNISKLLHSIGNESNGRIFFERYYADEATTEGIIINATSLPNSISVRFNEWGRNDGSIDKQFRLLFVIKESDKIPLFYRLLPGNIVDVSTLERTLLELKLLHITGKFVLLDAGFFSEENIKGLQDKKINFLIRLPKGRKIYKKVLENETSNLEDLKYGVKTGNRLVFIKRITTKLYDQEVYVYLILDPQRKSKELEKIGINYIEGNRKNLVDKYKVLNCGVMMLMSSIPIEVDEILGTYYSRISIEQCFSFMKSDLEILPIRQHKESTIDGFLFIRFLSLLLFIELRRKLKGEYTVEQALMLAGNLKYKVYEKEIFIDEPNKKQKEVFELFNIIVPKKCGI